MAKKRTKSKNLTPQEIGAQKELILLWLIMTASPSYDPAQKKFSADKIVNGISTELQKSSRGWNWPNLTPAGAKQFAQHAFPTMTKTMAKATAKKRTGKVKDAVSISLEFSDVIGSFQDALSGATSSPWPPSKTHPPVTEVAANLGLI